MNTTLAALRSRAVVLRRQEGVWGLAKGILRHTRGLLRRVAHVGSYYVYCYPIPSVDEDRFQPAVEHLEVRTVESREDVARLVEDGFEAPCVKIRSMERRLAAGAFAVCGFVDGRLAYIGWVATSAQAKQSFDRLPYRVAFDEGEAVTGGAWTAPCFRGLGLYRYMFGRELDYLRVLGRTSCRNAIAVGNIGSQRGQAIYGAEVCARARSVRVLGKRWWSEQPMSGPCPSLARKRQRGEHAPAKGVGDYSASVVDGRG